MEYLAKKSFSLLQDSAFTSINIETYTNKRNILQKSRFPFCKILHLLVIIKDIIINGISCKKVVLLSARLCMNSTELHGTHHRTPRKKLPSMEYLAKKSFSFLQDFAFTSINNETCTNKWNISRKSRFPFCKILHLLVLTMKHVLINGISREKVVFFFARFCIY